jgi:ATP-dependent RNA helicase DOB1
VLNEILIFTELRKTEEQYNSINVPNEDQVSTYYKIRQQLDNLGSDLLTYIQKPQYLLPFLQPGRLVKVCI